MVVCVVSLSVMFELYRDPVIAHHSEVPVKLVWLRKQLLSSSIACHSPHSGVALDRTQVGIDSLPGDRKSVV